MHLAPQLSDLGLALEQPSTLVSDADLERLAWAESMFAGHQAREQLERIGIERDVA